MRDSKGRFVHGHKVISNRDKSTGRFVSKPKDRYSQVRAEVDALLEDADKG